ncbi:arabinose-5-phosphate isomerase [Spirochaetia bacterium]|nr:arabinose-5-phosphate isomerase [Spirochaetia bacterium]
MNNIRATAIQCLRDEAQALLELIPSLSDEFDKAIELIYHCKGKIIVTGVGKSGHIGAKIASTLASTGTPAFFVNPVDALHGDLGMIAIDDIVLVISNSGQTDELLRVIPFLAKRNILLIGISGNPNSLLAQYSNYHITVKVEKEACPLNLAPTSSTTAALAMGDAIACALINLRGFKKQDYAQFHPGGSLGKRLLMRVRDVMRSENIPIAAPDEKIADVFIKISEGRLGLIVIIEGDKLLGIATDGDIRRIIQKNRDNFLDLTMKDIMNKTPITIRHDDFLSEAERVFRKNKLNIIIVLDEHDNFLGVLDIKECQI